MPLLDPASLLFTNGLLSLVLTAVMLVSRIGLGDTAVGVRTWILGDLFLASARGLVFLELMNPGFGAAAGLGFPVSSGPLVLAGIVCHLHALRRLAGAPTTNTALALQCAAAAALFALPAQLLPDASAKLHWMDVLIGGLSFLTLRACWPVRRLWGARLIGGMMLLSCTVQSVRLAALLSGQPLGGGPNDLPLESHDVRPLVLELVIALMLTAAYTLLLQERLRERIERLVVTDALTGVLNRRGLMPPLERELAQAARSGRPMSVVLFDLDHFKRVNDEYGHAVGDSVLAGFAARVNTLLRGGDLFGRWGGEEFLLLLPGTAACDALGVADRIRAVVAQAPLAAGAPSVTVSGGVASAAEVQGIAQALLKMLELADERLYEAKRTRNRLVAPPA